MRVNWNSKTHRYFFPISTSGNSLNIVLAVKKAKVLSIPVVAVTGKDGENLKSLYEYICAHQVIRPEVKNVILL